MPTIASGGSRGAPAPRGGGARPDARGVRTAGRRLVALAAAVLVAVGCGSTVAPTASPPAPLPARVADAITEGGLRADLAMLSAAGATSPTFRALGSPGYDAAVAAVEGALRGAGWSVREDVFSTPAFVDDGASNLQVGGRTFGREDLRPLIYAPSGVVEGPVVAVGWAPGAPTPGGSGCRSLDYGTLPAKAIVIVGPDDCYRRQAVAAAQAAGAAAFVAVSSNPAGGPPLRPTLITPTGIEIPAVAVSMEAATALRTSADAGGSARLVSTGRTVEAVTRSVIAELTGATPEHVVMVGAHLDSVLDGPGLNDNGSGTAALLGLARALAGTRPQATVRLAFWAAEEEGLLGSTHYATGLGSSDLAAMVAYLNADMIGSPNGYAGVDDEQGSPTGSPAVRALLERSVERLGGTPASADTGGGSDHAPFARAGVPVGGVFSGASELVTAEQSKSFGAAVGRPADACYHQACDGLENVSLPLARLLAAALADTAVRIAENPVLVTR